MSETKGFVPNEETLQIACKIQERREKSGIDEKERRRIASRLSTHAKIEERDNVAWGWARMMASAVIKKGNITSIEMLVGTLHNVGRLQDVSLFIHQIANQRCDCRQQWEAQHEGIKTVDGELMEWEDVSYNHDCIQQEARTLIGELEGD